MTLVKVCGITTRDDARGAVGCGVDAIGFVFAESPRRITPEAAGEVMREVGPLVTGVGVFVNASPAEVRRALVTGGCTVAQLHGNEDDSFIDALAPHAVVKAIRVRGEVDQAMLVGWRRAGAILLDTLVPGQAGGTGRRFDPSIAAGLVREGWRVIVAGGLTPENVGDLVRLVRPYAVDVSSGVEIEPGRKDPGRIAEFIAAVRAADREVS